MLEDIVIDTNVLAHMHNDQEARQPESIAFAKAMILAETMLCVDKGFDTDPAKNRSIIGAEYIEHLVFGSLGFALIARLAAAGRIVEYKKKPPQRESKKLDQSIRKQSDKAFLGVAVNSKNKICVSHDYRDFQAEKRATLKNTIRVKIINAGECLSEYFDEPNAE